MQNERKFISMGNGSAPQQTTADVVNPANEEVVGTIALGDQEDVNAAVAAAKKAFKQFSQTTVDERAALLKGVVEAYKKRIPISQQPLERNGGAVVARECRAGAGRGRALPDDARHAEGLRMGKRHRSQPHRA